uniref:Uncharacterized protein n=1 Tax=Panagrolaimus sp. ES5 TaxID=591445 RepID=A0AC34F3T9_9BILA
MEWNNIENADDPMLCDAYERDTVLEGLLDLEDERLNHRAEGIQTTYDNPTITDEFHPFEMTALTNLDAPASTQAIISEPQSVQILPEINENAPQSAKKKKVPAKISKATSSTDRPQTRKNRRGRPQSNNDGTINRKRVDAENNERMLQSLYGALKHMDATNPKYKGILEAVKVMVPNFENMFSMH